jgi:hypothetical protein
MYRVSVTTIEKFRRFMAGASPFDTEEALLETIKGIFVGNDKTKVGSAYHKLIEGKFEKKNRLYVADGISFTSDQAIPALKYSMDHRFVVNEVDQYKVYETNYFPIQVSGRVDSIHGVFIRDAKARFRNVNVEDYYESFQWRFYLDMLDADTFFYDSFEIKGFDALPMKDDVQIIAHEPFECIRYDRMQEDVVYLLNAFLEYLHFRNIVHLLKPAIEEKSFA